MKITEHDRADGTRPGGQSTGLPEGRALMAINARQDVRQYAAEAGVVENAAIDHGLQAKARGFQEAGSELYAKP